VRVLFLLSILLLTCAGCSSRQQTHSEKQSTVAIIEGLQLFESLIPVVPDSIIELYKRFDPTTFHSVYKADMNLATRFVDSMNATLEEPRRIDTLMIDHAMESFGHAGRSGGTIRLSSSYFLLFNDPAVVRSVLTHEFGHVQYERLPAALRDTVAQLWSAFERHALFYLFRDGEYSGNAKFGGHPHESPAELFASAFNLFVNRREEVNVRMKYISPELYTLVGRLNRVFRAARIL
jgi:hypothetical protein